MAILDRGEGNSKRKDRLAKLKKGPGVFVYDGSAHDVEHIPTILTVGKQVPSLDGVGMPVLDASGRQIYQLAGTPVYDGKGQPVLGGPPRVVRHKIKTLNIWGVDFAEGEHVEVTDPALALKLRRLACFSELEAVEVKEYASLKKGELMDIAEEKKITIPEGSTKAEIVALIEQSEAA